MQPMKSVHAIVALLLFVSLLALPALAAEAGSDEPDGQEAGVARASDQGEPGTAEEEADAIPDPDELPPFEAEIDVFDRVPQQHERSRSTTLLTDTALQGGHAANLNDHLFSGVPGVATSRRSNLGFSGPNAGFLIRGLTGPRVAVFVDGIPVQVNNHFHPRSDQYSPDMIHRLEITRGPSPVLHGPSAVGGVVEVFTRRPDPGLSGFVQGMTGDHETTEVQAEVGYGWDRGGLLVSWMDRETDAQVLGEAFDLRNANLKLNQQVSDEWSLGLRFSNTLEDPSNRFGSDPNEVFFRFTQDMTTWIASADRKTDHSTSLVAFHWNELDTGSFRESRTRPRFFENERVEQEVGLIARHTWIPDARSSWTVGVDLVEFTDENPRGSSEESESYVSPYGYTTRSLSDATRVEGGLRLTTSDQFGTDVSPEVGLVHTFDPSMALRVRTGKAFRVPRVSEVAVNQDLDPEDFYFAEVGLNKRLGSRLELDGAVWAMEGDNLIERIGSGGSTRNVNIGEFSHQGVEGSASWRTTEELTLFGGVALLEVDEGGSSVPQQTVDAGADFLAGPFRGTALVRWAGDNVNPLIDDYLVGDLRLRYRVWGGFALLLDVLNFTDEQYATFANRFGALDQPGRTVLGGIRYGWGDR